MIKRLSALILIPYNYVKILNNINNDEKLIPEYKNKINEFKNLYNNETNIDKLLEISSRDDVANMIINELNAEMPFDEVVEIADDFLRSDDIETKKVGKFLANPSIT